MDVSLSFLASLRIEALDLSYIRRWLSEFGAALGDSAASDLFETLLREDPS
ncbi:MAG: hypothetical protein M3R62_14735 [Acidobacteriota bacterium]|nr:hypothetical protein [Acidobacteriota bacterium]